MLAERSARLPRRGGRCHSRRSSTGWRWHSAHSERNRYAVPPSHISKQRDERQALEVNPKLQEIHPLDHRKHGETRASDALQPTSTATTVRVSRTASRWVLTAQFAETREALLGYYLIDAKPGRGAPHRRTLAVGARRLDRRVRPIMSVLSAGRTGARRTLALEPRQLVKHLRAQAPPCRRSPSCFTARAGACWPR